MVDYPAVLNFNSQMNPTFLAIFLLVALPTYGAENTGCSSISFSEVRSLFGLPKEVAARLSESGRNDIADSNEKFNATDVIKVGYENAPFRRFSLAAVSPSRILVAVEHGGRGYSVELWNFERSDGSWCGEKRGAIYKVPDSLGELVDHMCK